LAQGFSFASAATRASSGRKSRSEAVVAAAGADEAADADEAEGPAADDVADDDMPRVFRRPWQRIEQALAAHSLQVL
jgi:hypothetical protein